MVMAYLERRKQKKSQANMERKLGVGTPGIVPKSKAKGAPKGACQQHWKYGKCSRGDNCSYDHVENPQRKATSTANQRSTPTRKKTPRGRQGRSRERNREKGGSSRSKTPSRGGSKSKSPVWKSSPRKIPEEFLRDFIILGKVSNSKIFCRCCVFA